MSINASAIDLLKQLSTVMDGLTDTQFVTKVPVLSNATIGQHVRHTLEFFICLMDAKNEGVINYDERKHDKFIEQETQLAGSVIQSVEEFLQKETEDFRLVLKANYSVEDDSSETIPTNFYRELAYNIEHAIHHMALIKIGCKAVCPALVLPEHFGVASSTVRYHQSQR
ncbi:MAG: DinB family protein [Cyclobacteriaceae bacterium]